MVRGRELMVVSVVVPDQCYPRPCSRSVVKSQGLHVKSQSPPPITHQDGLGESQGRVLIKQISSPKPCNFLRYHLNSRPEIIQFRTQTSACELSVLVDAFEHPYRSNVNSKSPVR